MAIKYDGKGIGVSPMSGRSPRQATLRKYVAEVLKNATYEKGEVLNVMIAEVPDLLGCFTQGSSFEEARENLIDAIEVWIMSALQSGEGLPVVNGCQLAINAAQGGVSVPNPHSGDVDPVLIRRILHHTDIRVEEWNRA